MTPDAQLRAEPETVRALELADFLLIAEAVLGIPAKRVAEESSLHLADSALHAPLACYGGEDFYPDFATKAAVLSLTRTLAFEEGGHGVRVNAICPGFTRTPFHVNRLGVAKVDELVPPCVLQRWADPEELAYPMLWLASDEASYVTAATFMIDGGLPA